jgi:hypothetical protein
MPARKSPTQAPETVDPGPPQAVAKRTIVAPARINRLLVMDSRGGR